jgi:hypothetical protein
MPFKFITIVVIPRNISGLYNDWVRGWTTETLGFDSRQVQQSDIFYRPQSRYPVSRPRYDAWISRMRSSDLTRRHSSGEEHMSLQQCINRRKSKYLCIVMYQLWKTGYLFDLRTCYYLKHRLNVLEKRVLRKLFIPQREETRGGRHICIMRSSIICTPRQVLLA